MRSIKDRAGGDILTRSYQDDNSSGLSIESIPPHPCRRCGSQSRGPPMGGRSYASALSQGHLRRPDDERFLSAFT